MTGNGSRILGKEPYISSNEPYILSGGFGAGWGVFLFGTTNNESWIVGKDPYISAKEP